jgi:hypothetical protein
MQGSAALLPNEVAEPVLLNGVPEPELQDGEGHRE